MSLARYLANLLNSSGQVPDAKLVALTASKLTGQVPDANAPSGSVIQVVQGTTSTAMSTSGATFVATNLSVSITPISTSSKILVFGQLFVANGVSTNQPTIGLFRNGSNIIGPGYGFGDTYTSAGGYGEAVLPFSFLDTPSSISSLLYAIYGRNPSGTGNSTFNDPARLSVITAMEISA
jgi:hypothetical protein